MQKEDKIEKLKNKDYTVSSDAEFKAIYNGFWNFCKQLDKKGERTAYIMVIRKSCNKRVYKAVGCYPHKAYPVIIDQNAESYANKLWNYFRENGFAPGTGCHHTGEERYNINFYWD